MSTSVGTISLDMVLNGTKFKKQLGNMQNQANSASQKMAASFKKIGASVAAAFSTAMIAKFGKSCIDLGSDLAEVQNVVDVTFTTMSDKVNEWAVNAQKAYGLSETMAKKYVGTFGSMAEAFGFTEQQSYDMATSLTGLTGDVASFYNLSQDLAYTKLKSVFSGETETLKDLGIVMTQSALDSYALANGYTKTVKEMTEAEKVTLRYNFVLGQLKNATGDFTRTQDSWANQTRILSLRFDSLKATIGQGIINAFTPVIKVVNSLIDRLSTVSEKFKALTEQIFGNAGGSTAGRVDTAIADSASSAESLTNEANNSSAALDSVADSAEKAKKSVAGFDKLNVLSKDSKTETNSTTPATTTQNQSSGNNLTSAMSKSVDKLVSSWNSKGQKVIESMKKAFNSVKGVVQSIGDSWKKVWNNGSGSKLLNNIKDLLKHCFNNIADIADAFKKAWDKAGLGDSVIQSIIDRANSLIGLIDVIAEDFAKVWNNGTGERIWSNILGIIKNCNNYVSTLSDKIKLAWEKGGAGEKIWNTILGIVEDITGFLNDMSLIRLEWLESLDLSPIVTAVSNLGEAFRKLLKVCGDKLKSAYQNILLPLAKWTIEKAVPKLVEALAGAFDMLSKFIKKIPISLLAGVATAIGTIVAAFKAFKIAKELKRNFDIIKKSFLSFKRNVLTSHPYAATITAIAAAIGGVIAAMQTYSNEKWENSSLKKEIDKTNKLTDEWNELADEMSTKIEEINDTELSMKVDFENVDKMKKRLQEIIDDGTIDDSEKGEYKTIVDLLKEKVDGFETNWNNLTLEEIDGNIVIKDNVDEVNKNLDDLVAKWEITQAKLTFSDVFSSLQTDVEKEKANYNALKNQDNAGKTKESFIDYIFENSRLSQNESKILAEELIKTNGSFNKAVDSIRNKFNNKTLDKEKYKNLFETIGDKFYTPEGSIKASFWDTNATERIEEYIDEINDYSDGIKNSQSYLQSLNEERDEAYKKLQALNGSTEDYNTLISLSNEYGLSHEAVLSLVKDQGITTWGELESAAKKQGTTTSEVTDGIVKSTDKAKKKANNNTNDIVREPAKAVSRETKSAENASLKFTSRFIAPFSAIVEKIKNKLEPVKSVFSNIFGGICQVIKNPLNALMSNLENFINGFIGGINSIASGADWAINNIGQIFGQEWHVGQLEKVTLPRFAKGAIVKAPTLAVVGDNAGANTGDPEVISPLSKLQSMIKTSSGEDVVILKQMLDYLKRIYEMFVIFRNNGGNHYEFVAKINGSEIFDEIVKQNELYKKRHGGKSAFA